MEVGRDKERAAVRCQTLRAYTRSRVNQQRLEPLAQFDRYLAPSTNYGTQQRMSRSPLRIVNRRRVQMLQLIIPELLYYSSQQRQTWVIGKILQGFELTVGKRSESWMGGVLKERRTLDSVPR